MSAWGAVGLSIFVFAGAAQFVAVSMIMNGAPPAVVISAAFAVNFRHVLMSAALSSHAAEWSAPKRALFGAMLTDESFALHSVHFAEGDADYVAAVVMNTSAYLSWVAFGVIGHSLGALVSGSEAEALGLDFALPAMFIGLLMPSCRNGRAVTAALCGGVTAVALYLSGLGRWAAFAGAAAGAAAGAFAPFGERDER